MIKGFEDKSFWRLIDNMNKFAKENDVFATNIFQPNNKSDFWYGLSFYKQGNTLIHSTNSTPASNTSKPASQKQIDLLYKLNADFNAEEITKQEAIVLINELLEKQIKKDKKRKDGNKI